MLPRYERLNEVIRGAGCEVIYLDCDGNIDQLMPLWLEAGINLFWPLECAAGMDPLALRKQYGKEIILAGGLDKRELMRDKESLRREVMSKVPVPGRDRAVLPQPGPPRAHRHAVRELLLLHRAAARDPRRRAPGLPGAPRR